MEELLSMLDSSVFTDEIKDKIRQEFDKAVEAQVELQIAQTTADNEDGQDDKDDKESSEFDIDGEDKYEGEEAILNTMSKKEIVEKAERFLNSEITKLTEKADKYGKYVTECMADKADKYAKYVVESQEKADEARIDTYLNTVVDSIVESYAKENVELKTNIAKADVLVEGFQSMLLSGGVYLKDIITESEKIAKPDLSVELDAKIMENKQLKDSINELKREKVLGTLTEGLTVVQKESVLKTQKHLKFTDEAKFVAQVTQLVETAKIKPDELSKTSSKINENKSTSKLGEDTHQRFF